MERHDGSTDKLTLFFYLLLRDHLPVGVVNSILAKVDSTKDRVTYSDEDLETMARRMAIQLEDYEA